MKTLRLTKEDFKDGKYIGKTSLEGYEGNVKIDGGLGQIVFERIDVAGYLSVNYGTSIETVDYIESGTSIEAGGSINAGNSYCGGYDACKVNGCSCTDPRQERKKQVDETALEKCLAMAEDYAKEKVNGYLAEIHEFCYGTRDIGSIVSGHKIPTPDALQDLLCQLEVVE